MATEIREYCESMVPAVIEFNNRLTAGKVPMAFPESHISTRFPRIPGRKLFQQYYVAVDDHTTVRGGYVLQHQEFQIGGRPLTIAFLGLPISEGAVNRAYSPVGVQLLRDALQRQPLLFALGMGGYGENVAQFLQAANWNMVSVPFFFRIVRPARFLRNVTYLRTSASRRWALDLLAGSGLGWLGVRLVQNICTRHFNRRSSIRAEAVEQFSDWASVLWEKHKDDYGMTAIRDLDTLRILYPDCKNKFLLIKVVEQDAVIGWAVLLNTQLSKHKQFGNARLGSLVDCFSAPQDAGKVVGCATRALEERGADLIVTNQSHAAWCAAMKPAGYLRGPSNFLFATSPSLTAMLAQQGVGAGDLHMNRGDGDGPVNL